MRGIFFTTLALLAFGWLASTIELPQAWSHSDAARAAAIQDDSEQVLWRRTAQGWEKRTKWCTAGSDPQDVRQPLIVHPVAIAVVQGLAAVFATRK
jgi:hypothetical protein